MVKKTYAEITDEIIAHAKAMAEKHRHNRAYCKGHPVDQDRKISDEQSEADFRKLWDLDALSYKKGNIIE